MTENCWLREQCDLIVALKDWAWIVKSFLGEWMVEMMGALLFLNIKDKESAMSSLGDVDWENSWRRGDLCAHETKLDSYFLDCVGDHLLTSQYWILSWLPSPRISKETFQSQVLKHIARIEVAIWLFSGCEYIMGQQPLWECGMWHINFS